MLVFSIVLALASSADQDGMAATRTAGAPSSGKIVMFRSSSIVGAAVGCPVRYQEKEIVELGRGKFAEWTVPAGKYVLGNKSNSLEVAVAPGETRYVQCSIGFGLMAGGSKLKLVEAQSFTKKAADYDRKEIVDPLGN